jgi:hypothetical protein
VGFQAAGDEGWTFDGEAGVTNSVSVKAGFPETGFFSHYVNGKYDYHKDVAIVGSGGGTCAGVGDHKQHSVSWAGTAVAGGLTADRRGGDTCHGALDTVILNPRGGHDTKSGGESVFWKVGVAIPMGFSFGDRTGYSHNVTETWTNNNRHYSYLCGPNNTASNHVGFDRWDIVYNYNQK